MALARLLPIAPNLSLYAENIALNQKADVFGILSSRSATALSSVPEDDLGTLLLALLRLLAFNNHVFAPLVSPAQMRMLFSHKTLYIRFLAIRVFGAYVHASEALLAELLVQHSLEEQP